MTYSVNQIADYFVWRANSEAEFGENITNLKLQKLVYYAQGFSLALNDYPLFNESIKAWAHRPVVPGLYYRFRDRGASPIDTPVDFDLDSIDAETQALLDEVYDVYGQYSAWGLRNLTHDEPPWNETKTGDTIDLDKMKAYFSTQLSDA